MPHVSQAFHPLRQVLPPVRIPRRPCPLHSFIDALEPGHSSRQRGLQAGCSPCASRPGVPLACSLAHAYSLSFCCAQLSFKPLFISNCIILLGLGTAFPPRTCHHACPAHHLLCLPPCSPAISLACDDDVAVEIPCSAGLSCKINHWAWCASVSTIFMMHNECNACDQTLAHGCSAAPCSRPF